MADRPRTFRPDYGIEAPQPDPVVIPWWALLAAFFAACVIAGYIARTAGFL